MVLLMGDWMRGYDKGTKKRLGKVGLEETEKHDFSCTAGIRLKKN